MDAVRAKERLWALAQRYRYPLLILLAGLGLMLLPTASETAPAASEPAALEAPADLQQQLQEVLARIEGAGQVRVLLTERVGAQQVYQTDLQLEEGESDTRRSEQTVLLEGEDRSEQPIPVKTLGPEYLGAVVVCQGADDAKVRLAVVEAVRCATGLGADAISVQKME